MNIKKGFLVLAISGIAALVTTGIFAQCGSTTPVANVAGWQQNVTGTLGTTAYAHFWQYGTPANNSGTVPQGPLMATPYSTGYYVTSDWGNTGVVGCPGAVPTGTSTTFLYSIANSGTAQYLVMTAAWSVTKNRYDFDAITNGPGNTPSPVNIPTISAVSAAGPLGDGSYDLTITWTPISGSSLLGYYDSAPTTNVVTGIAAYRYNGATPPTNFAKSAWTLASGGPNSRTGYVSFAGAYPGPTDPGTMIVNVPGPIANVDYLALTVLFDGATPGDTIRETQFVGPYFSKPIGPTASPLFANVTADPTNVSWTSGDESRVASYQAYWSPAINGTYRPLGQAVAAQGPGHSYSVNYRVIAPVYYVKIKASKTDGTVVWSNPIKVTRLAPRPLPGKLMPHKPGSPRLND